MTSGITLTHNTDPGWVLQNTVNNPGRSQKTHNNGSRMGSSKHSQ